MSIFLLPQNTTGCGDDCSEIKWGYSDNEFEQYNTNFSNKSLSGIVYDPSGLPISSQLIDRLTNEVETCLTNNFVHGEFPDDVVRDAQCSQKTFQLPLQRTNFGIKIANDWVLSCDGTEQLLPMPVKAGPSGCLAKGQTPNTQCPCRWRAGIKCPNIIIVTPNFYLYKDALVRYTTSCRNPWGNPKLAQCVTPTTTPLSDGSDPNNGLN